VSSNILDNVKSPVWVYKPVLEKLSLTDGPSVSEKDAESEYASVGPNTIDSENRADSVTAFVIKNSSDCEKLSVAEKLSDNDNESEGEKL
jgi:hypothetical protein